MFVWYFGSMPIFFQIMKDFCWITLLEQKLPTSGPRGTLGCTLKKSEIYWIFYSLSKEGNLEPMKKWRQPQNIFLIFITFFFLWKYYDQYNNVLGKITYAIFFMPILYITCVECKHCPYNESLQQRVLKIFFKKLHADIICF